MATSMNQGEEKEQGVSEVTDEKADGGIADSSSFIK